MKEQKGRGKKDHALTDTPRNGAGGLLKTGVFSLLLHMVLFLFLMVTLKTDITKARSFIYQVTIQPFSSQNNSGMDPIEGLPSDLPVLEKNRIQKEEHKKTEEIKPDEPVKEPEQLLQHPPKEEMVKKPIPLPMGDGSTLDEDSSLEEEDNLPIVFIPPHLAERYSNIVSDIHSGSGTGGSGEESGTGQGGSGMGGSGDGLLVGQGDSPGRGFGRGRGIGQGGSGWGGFGNGRSGVARPNYAQNPKPVYPLEAREKGYEGEVLLKVEVLSNGRVGHIEVKRSSGYDILDQAALTTVKKWRFIPAREGDVAIPIWVNIPIKFQLL
jgi:TonB family protein